MVFTRTALPRALLLGLCERTRGQLQRLAQFSCVCILFFIIADRGSLPYADWLRIFYPRFFTAALLAVQSFYLGRAQATSWIVVQGYLTHGLVQGLLFALQWLLGAHTFTSNGWAILLVCCLSLPLWSSWHTAINATLVAVCWALRVRLSGGEILAESTLIDGTAIILAGVAVTYSGHLLYWLNVVNIEKTLMLEKMVTGLEGMNEQVWHDVRSPLDVLRRITNERDLSSAASHRELLHAATDRIEGVMAYLTRGSRGRMPQQTFWRPTDLDALLQQLVAEKQILFRERSISFEATSALDSKTRVAMPLRALQRVFSNLLNNAAEASDIGAVVRIKAHQRDQSAVVEIRDTGCGIAAAELPRVLQGGVSIGKPGGTGLGLSSSVHLVAEYNGILSIDSTVGVGTQVNVELPLDTAATPC